MMSSMNQTQTPLDAANAAHAARWAEAAAAHGSQWLPRDVEFKLQEQLRLELCAALGKDARGRDLAVRVVETVTETETETETDA
jgi:hypothetical protein